MFENNIYNIDREFDYTTIKDTVLKSLARIAKEEALKKQNVYNDVVFDPICIDDSFDNVSPDDLRRLIQKQALESRLLSLIGHAEREKELQKTVAKITRDKDRLEADDSQEIELDENESKKIHRSCNEGSKKEG